MNRLTLALFLLAVWLLVFVQSWAWGLPRVLFVQVDLVPSMVVFAAMRSGVLPFSAAAVLGGLGYDALSANPLGVSLLPLALVGLGVHLCQDLVLRSELPAQWILGFCGGAAAPLLSLMLLWAMGREPLSGLRTVWEIAVLGVLNGVAVPVWAVLFRYVESGLSYSARGEVSFRQDREMERGRH